MLCIFLGFYCLGYKFTTNQCYKKLSFQFSLKRLMEEHFKMICRYKKEIVF